MIFTKFKVEFILDRNQYGLIVVKYLSGVRDFEITNESRLESIPIKEYLDMPRKVDDNGNLILDCYILQPKCKKDLTKFQVGQIVKLI